MGKKHGRSRWFCAVVTVLATVVLAGCTGGGSSGTGRERPGAAGATAASPTRTAQDPGKPNIVFVLTDDLSMNMLPYMPAVQQMAKDGTSFGKYFVTDSLCCPSRASIFTGRYPHNTGIYRNVGTDGGYLTFRALGLESDTVATDLQKAGYRTAMMGKYLNQYQPGIPAKPRKPPQGWNEWDVAGYGYNGFDYNLNQSGSVVHYGSDPQDYLTDVLSGRGQDFIKRSAAANQPFMMEIATFTPHSPYVPAPRDRNAFPGLKVPRVASYGAMTKNAPSWLKRYRLTPADRASMDADYRLRAQDVQSVDAMITGLRNQLSASGIADNTYLVFSSDNGYHMGEHSLTSGKTTAFDTDIQVPMIVVGPDVAKGRTVPDLASNIDLRPTFVDLAGGKVPATVDGQSLAPLWRTGTSKTEVAERGAAAARKFVLVEHHGPVTNPKDPDYPLPAGGNPPDYEAMRGKNWVYVVYKGGEQEYYDIAKDPEELDNIVASVPKKHLAVLHRTMLKAERCAGQVSCSRAQQGL